METKIIDGKAVAANIRAALAKDVESLKLNGVNPSLAVILVGNDPASVSYVTGKRKAMEEIGIEDRTILLPNGTSEDELLDTIEKLNKDDSVHGILVQLPLPKHINEKKVIDAIDPR